MLANVKTLSRLTIQVSNMLFYVLNLITFVTFMFSCHLKRLCKFIQNFCVLSRSTIVELSQRLYWLTLILLTSIVFLKCNISPYFNRKKHNIIKSVFFSFLFSLQNKNFHIFLFFYLLLSVAQTISSIQGTPVKSMNLHQDLILQNETKNNHKAITSQYVGAEITVNLAAPSKAETFIK